MADPTPQDLAEAYASLLAEMTATAAGARAQVKALLRENAELKAGPEELPGGAT